uniref:Uncharacterized protein n=1 Tax=Strongyloides papillosus TaxID=174720 RepID=A0A0N5BYS5_STREA
MDLKDNFHEPLDNFKKEIDHFESFANENAVYLHEAIDNCFGNIVRWQFSMEPTFKITKSRFEKVRILKNIIQEKFELTTARWICELQKHIGAEESHPIEEIKKLFFKKQRITETQFQTMIGM